MKPTMTVAELQAALQKYSQDTPVYALWEGVLAPVRLENFSLEVKYCGKYLAKPQLEIFVEEY